MLFFLPATENPTPFFFESPAGLDPNMREVVSHATFTVPNNYFFLNLLLKVDIVDQLQEIIEEETDAMAPFEWCRIPITFSGGQTTIFCCNLPERMLVRLAANFRHDELEGLLQRFSV
jgi:hypothetical protein